MLKHVKYWLVYGCFAASFAACNQMTEQRGNQDQANDTTRAPTPAPTEDRPTFKLDTTYKDYRFSISTRGDATLRNLYIGIGTIRDSSRMDTIIEKDIKGNVGRVAVADIDKDGQPEIYVFSISGGAALNESVYGLVIGKNGALKINTSDVDSLNAKDYRGRDSFFVQKNELVRTYPAFEEGQQHALTTDARKIIRYKLVKSGDGYTLKTQ
ncbi:hypothetical protein SAMN04488128_103261 [Chitinophaga eiseniae]|uniref:FG-GAP repeat-containing protein n=1 Tax=Chitinophaga eiseniae TaxID=634771 RepID=A0A1T4SPY9_9BACT|nr:hypothetical protein [Chitinophaga eiseniae]SKA30285.1 hypothetical protein SAMN04488128_103261 [Chitinophaga eiseniae]